MSKEKVVIGSLEIEKRAWTIFLSCVHDIVNEISTIIKS